MSAFKMPQTLGNTKLIRSASEYPGVGKFGIALEWGSRGLEFESQHSDHGKS